MFTQVDLVSSRWISTVSRPRAKLLRDVFVVSFAGVCGLWHTKSQTCSSIGRGTRERRVLGRREEGVEKLGVGWKPSFHVPSKRTTHPIIVSSRQGALSVHAIDTRAPSSSYLFFVCIRFNETRRGRLINETMIDSLLIDLNIEFGTTNFLYEWKS